MHFFYSFSIICLRELEKSSKFEKLISYNAPLKQFFLVSAKKSKTSFSRIFNRKGFEVNTNLNGEERALVVTGEMEKFFPFDIYPMQL